jgi:hypothetical protein
MRDSRCVISSATRALQIYSHDFVFPTICAFSLTSTSRYFLYHVASSSSRISLEPCRISFVCLHLFGDFLLFSVSMDRSYPQRKSRGRDVAQTCPSASRSNALDGNGTFSRATPGTQHTYPGSWSLEGDSHGYEADVVDGYARGKCRSDDYELDDYGNTNTQIQFLMPT